MRLFVALWPSDEARDHLRRHLSGRPELVAADRWHITLCFLGDVAQERLPDVERALDAVPTHPPVVLRLTGHRTFGRSVAAAGVAGDLSTLHRDMVAALDADPRPLIPHLTVTYHRSADIEHTLSGYRGPSWTAAEFTLVRSANGYHPLRSWPLRG